jgi:hypothetical protein
MKVVTQLLNDLQNSLDVVDFNSRLMKSTTKKEFEDELEAAIGDNSWKNSIFHI